MFIPTEEFLIPTLISTNEANAGSETQLVIARSSKTS